MKKTIIRCIELLVVFILLLLPKTTHSDIAAVASGAETKDKTLAHLYFLDVQAGEIVFDATFPGESAIPTGLFMYNDNLYTTAWRHRDIIKGSGAVFCRFNFEKLELDQLHVFNGMSLDFPILDQNTGRLIFESIDSDESLSLSLTGDPSSIKPIHAPVYLARLRSLNDSGYVLYDKNTLAFLKNPFGIAGFHEAVAREKSTYISITHKLPMMSKVEKINSRIIVEIIDIKGDKYLLLFDRNDVNQFLTVPSRPSLSLIGKDSKSNSLLLCDLPYVGQEENDLKLLKLDLESLELSIFASATVDYEKFGAVALCKTAFNERFILVGGTSNTDYGKTFPGMLAIYDRDEKQFSFVEFPAGPVRKIVELSPEKQKELLGKVE